jgi:transposase-like protein
MRFADHLFKRHRFDRRVIVLCVLNEHRDAGAAKAFFCRAILLQEPPKQVTLNGHQASHRIVEGLKEEGLMP